MYMKMLVVAGVIAAGPISAKQTYAAYEGTAASQIGTGGTKITKNGIDYWTTGSPARRYQILGVLIDARKGRITDGSVLGSKSVAEKAKAAGGDAVLLETAEARGAGIAGLPTRTDQLTRTTTQITVIKYLPPE